MEYMLFFNETAEAFAVRSDPLKAGPHMAAWGAYIGAMVQAGVMKSGNGLLGPETATTVRLHNGATQVQDGPHADSKEQLGGFAIIDVPSLDVALEWAARSPSSAYGSTEVRPVMPPMAR